MITDFIWEGFKDSPDVERLFGPFEPGELEDIVWCPLNFTIEDIAVKIGAFPSKSQARKNGWHGHVPRGFKMHKIGKRYFFTYFPLD